MKEEFDVIMYRKVFPMHNLTASERMVYSYLVGVSVIDEVGFTCMYEYDSGARISVENLAEGSWRHIGKVSDTKVGKHTSLTRMGAYKARLGLIEKGLIKGDMVYAPYELV